MIGWIILYFVIGLVLGIIDYCAFQFFVSEGTELFLIIILWPLFIIIGLFIQISNIILELVKFINYKICNDNHSKIR
jgi:hypothetical protein